MIAVPSWVDRLRHHRAAVAARGPIIERDAGLEWIARISTFVLWPIVVLGYWFFNEEVEL